MKHSNYASAIFLCLAAGSVAAIAAGENTAEFSLSYRYQVADTQKTEHGQQQVLLQSKQSATNDPRIEKAIFVAKLGDLIKNTLTNFKSQCSEPTIEPLPFIPAATSIMLPEIIPIPVEPSVCDDVKATLADQLRADIYTYAQQAAINSATAYDEEVAETFDLLRKLATNMQDFDGYFGSIETMPVASIGGGGFGRATTSIGVTTGGAQDFGFFKNTVKNGGVPLPESFDPKGFLSEFNLPMGDGACDQLLCITPVYKYDSENKNLFVAVAMNTNVTEETFQRKPLNLSLVIDISGSMSANDDTEKTRLEWAKEAAVKTIAELTSEDYVSLVVFDSAAEVLVLPTKLSSDANKDYILSVIASLETKGSTNLFDGLKAGYELVSDTAQQLTDYEHRVILISDAGLNTGVTDEAVNVGLVSNYAAENIGLTAIGLGLNFNQDFISGISQSLGGNYLYAHSGKDMVRYFSSFKFLVSPIAHHLKARLSFANTKATLVHAYGIPGEAVAATNELINVQSLFFTNQGGGAILLHYQLD